MAPAGVESPTVGQLGGGLNEHRMIEHPIPARRGHRRRPPACILPQHGHDEHDPARRFFNGRTDLVAERERSSPDARVTAASAASDSAAELVTPGAIQALERPVRGHAGARRRGCRRRPRRAARAPQLLSDVASEHPSHRELRTGPVTPTHRARAVRARRPGHCLRLRRRDRRPAAVGARRAPSALGVEVAATVLGGRPSSSSS
jgi:hypothetical protein